MWLFSLSTSLREKQAVVLWWKVCGERYLKRFVLRSTCSFFFHSCIPVEIFWVCNIWNTTSKPEVMASQDNNPLKRKQPDDSPDELSKNVDICRHCNKKCTKKSEAVQCDLCYLWLHTSCEGLNKEQCKLLTQLTSTVENVMYYCKFNKCETRSKQLM